MRILIVISGYRAKMSAIASEGHSAHLSTNWKRSAGDFMCIGPCRRKRLPASAFSKTQAKRAIEGVRTTGQKKAKCLNCVAEEEKATAEAAKSKPNSRREISQVGGTDNMSKQKKESALSDIRVKTDTNRGAGHSATLAARDKVENSSLHCSTCNCDLPASSFSNSQKTKISRGRQGRCIPCVEKSEEAELQKIADKRDAARKLLLEKAKAGGVADRLALACAETAAEAETITGLTAKVRRSRQKGGGGRWRAGRGRRGGRPRGRG